MEACQSGSTRILLRCIRGLRGKHLVLFLLIFMVISFVFRNKHLVNVKQRKEATTAEINKEITTPVEGIRKVLLVTFMRGGSSVLGELFNQNPDAFYWFEPLNGLYSHLYGTGSGWAPLDILTHDGKDRHLANFEKDAIRDTLTKIYSCNLTSLPLDVVTDYNALTLVQNRFITYTECMRYKGKVSAGYVQGLVENSANIVQEPFNRHMAFQCKERIANFCPKKYSPESLYNCYLSIHGNFSVTKMQRRERGDVVDVTEGQNENKAMVAGIPEPLLNQYSICMEEAKKDAEPCQDILPAECASTTLRVVKTIRMDLDTIMDILRDLPDLKVIMYFRDPRAVAVSRDNAYLLSDASDKKIEVETRLICQRMRKNLLSKLSKQYPGNFMRLNYEDLAKNPARTIDQISRFLGLITPNNVKQWVLKHFYGDREGGPFDTFRINATRTANKWTDYLTSDACSRLTELCADVLDDLGYKV